ncbi:hypothetical protein ACH474_22365 [Nocardia rhamnosiphila]|uniref:hypothetical protein n=1 Tax=Nocardia rhamnosiphila TaxID=426716 RepID=UPI00379CE816
MTGMVPHGLRRTATSLVISSDANIKIVRRMLGHKAATFTPDLYGHLFDDDLDLVADSTHRRALTAADSPRTEQGSDADPTAGNNHLPAA